MLKYLRMGNKRIKIVWWTLIVITIVTFVFLFGAGFGSGPQNQVAGALGTVNGRPITLEDYRIAVSEQRSQYMQRTQTDPGEAETRMLEVQAWRPLVTQALLDQQARKLGLKPTDREVVITLQSAPPQALM